MQDKITIPDVIEFELLDYDVKGSNIVTFELSDKTIVKVKVELDRAGIAKNNKNPDDSPHYAVNTSIKMLLIPSDRRFTIPRSEIANVNINPPEPKPELKPKDQSAIM